MLFPVDGQKQQLSMKHSSDIQCVENNVPDNASECCQRGRVMWEQLLAGGRAEEPPTDPSDSPVSERKALQEKPSSSGRSRRRSVTKATELSPLRETPVRNKKPRVQDVVPEVADEELGAVSMDLEEDDVEEEKLVERATTGRAAKHRPVAKPQSAKNAVVRRGAAVDEESDGNINAAIVYELGLEAGRRRQLQEDLFSFQNHNEDTRRMQLLRKKP